MPDECRVSVKYPEGSGHARLPLIKCLPSRLNGTDDSLKVGRILLHDDDHLLRCIFLVDLLVELTKDSKIGNKAAGNQAYDKEKKSCICTGRS